MRSLKRVVSMMPHRWMSMYSGQASLTRVDMFLRFKTKYYVYCSSRHFLVNRQVACSQKPESTKKKGCVSWSSRIFAFMCSRFSHVLASPMPMTSASDLDVYLLMAAWKYSVKQLIVDNVVKLNGCATGVNIDPCRSRRHSKRLKFVPAW